MSCGGQRSNWGKKKKARQCSGAVAAVFFLALAYPPYPSTETCAPVLGGRIPRSPQVRHAFFSRFSWTSPYEFLSKVHSTSPPRSRDAFAPGKNIENNNTTAPTIRETRKLQGQERRRVKIQRQVERRKRRVYDTIAEIGEVAWRLRRKEAIEAKRKVTRVRSRFAVRIDCLR